ncbi:ABC transporter ATP-binding protein [Saccharothrix longispora]|uniref:ABC transporter ATP-binding protein n=1 Tax=Saccharothrix longispora TaxID=33920 RepID=UPI0028FD8A5A|nr:ABC transporter ATP-binding protein [Saccharothrix longispora]MDU0289728.1 ABC transporter ATP-binding protein [Saccharothrix longispora]
MTGLRHFVVPLLRSHRRQVALLIACAVVEALPVLLSGHLVAAALDRGFLAGAPGLGLALLGAQACAAVVGALAGRQAVAPTARLVESLRDHVVEAAVRGGLLAAVEADHPGGAAATARITRQTETARHLAGSLLMVARTVVFSLAAVITGLALLVPAVLLVTLPCLLLGGCLLVPVTRSWRVRYDHALTVEESLATTIGRTLDGLRDVLACAAVERAEATADAVLRAQVAARSRVAAVAAGRVAAFAVMARLPLLTLLVAAPALLASGTTTPGALLGAATYLLVTVEPVTRTVIEVVGNLGLEFSAVLGRLAAHDRPVPPPEPPGRRVHGDLVLDAVTFRHGPHSHPVLDRSSLRVTAGEHLAVVGPSGIGKSTLATLLAGIRRPEHGTISLAGRPLPDIAEPYLRASVLLVPQDPYVVTGTVRENLAYLAPGTDDTRLTEAATRLGADEVIGRLGGLDGRIADPDMLSAGERQLLVAVRAYVADAPCTILDEATCHLDATTEARVETAFAARRGTLVVIAHRPASALRADRVLLLDGRHTTIGTHTDLRDTSRAYATFTGHWCRSAAVT